MDKRPNLFIETWPWAEQMSLLRQFLQFANTQSNADITLQLEEDRHASVYSPVQSPLQSAIATAAGTTVQEPKPTDKHHLRHQKS